MRNTEGGGWRVQQEAEWEALWMINSRKVEIDVLQHLLTVAEGIL